MIVEIDGEQFDVPDDATPDEIDALTRPAAAAPSGPLPEADLRRDTMKGSGRTLDIDLDPQTQSTGDAHRQAVRTFFRRVPGADYALGAGRYLENAISGKPTSYREALDTEREIQGNIASVDPGVASYGPEAALIAKLPYAAAKGARGLFARALGAGGTTAAGEYSRGASGEEAVVEGAKTGAGAATGELVLGKMLPHFARIYRGKASRHALKGTQANEFDVDLMRDRLGNPEDIGREALDLRTPTGEPTLPAFAHPETRLQNVQDTLATVGPLKTALVERAPGEINTGRLEQTIQGRVKSLDTRAEKFASGEKNIDQARGIFKRFKDQYRQEPRVVGVMADVEGAAVPARPGDVGRAGAELDDAANLSTQADTAAARLRRTEARDANIDLDRAGSLEAAQTAADTRRRVTQAAQDRAAAAAQNADEAQRSFDAVNDQGPNGLILDPRRSDPYRRQAQSEIDRAEATATAADRSAAAARRNADPLERMDDGRTEVGVLRDDGTRSATAFEAGGESNIGRTRRGATMASERAEAVETANEANLVHQNYHPDDLRREPDILRPRPDSGWHPVIERQDPMSVAEADAAYQALTDDVYSTASSRYPDRGASAIDYDPELRLKKGLAADILAEIEATINQNVPNGVGPLTAEGARYRDLRRLYEVNKSFEPTIRSAANRAAAVQQEATPWVARHAILPALGALGGHQTGGLSGAVLGGVGGMAAEAGYHAGRRYGHPALSRAYEGLAQGMDLGLKLDPVTIARIAAITGGVE